jgi:hypothetical protein
MTLKEFSLNSLEIELNVIDTDGTGRSYLAMSVFVLIFNKFLNELSIIR